MAVADTVTDTRPPAVFIMGPTASGKTALAVELAQRFPFEIISVDSALVYRGMDIGTAKPDAATLALAPHRLIDIRDPAESYSAAEFRADALAAMQDITERGRIPLLVGGTMLYFRALQQGLSRLPTADATVRARLEQERSTCGLMALYNRLQAIDPTAAARIHPHDPQRILRALEVFELSGRPLTELCAEPTAESLPYRTCRLIVAPTERHVLHQRIEERFLLMLKQGFVAEVEHLYERADLDLGKPAMRAVGYRQVWAYLDGAVDYPAMVQQGIAATRQFAKRQITWLRAEQEVTWLDSQAGELLARVVTCLDDARILPK